MASSSSTTVATVATSGAVATLAPGSATLGASLNGKSASTTLTVTAVPIALTTASLASGIKANFGTMVKPLHVGQSARNGLFAALLAEGGFDGRLVLVAEPDYAGFCRVIWNTHVREMTDLSAADQALSKVDQPGRKRVPFFKVAANLALAENRPSIAERSATAANAACRAAAAVGVQAILVLLRGLAEGGARVVAIA